MDHVRLRIHGRVQGVGYRHFIVTEARGLGVHGTVRNLEGGDVEILAEGDRAILYDLIDRARRGPAHARVLQVEAEWGEGPPRFQEFRIRP